MSRNSKNNIKPLEEHRKSCTEIPIRCLWYADKQWFLVTLILRWTWNVFSSEVLRFMSYSSTLFTEYMITLHTRHLPITDLHFKACIYTKDIYLCAITRQHSILQTIMKKKFLSYIWVHTVRVEEVIIRVVLWLWWDTTLPVDISCTQTLPHHANICHLFRMCNVSCK